MEDILNHLLGIAFKTKDGIKILYEDENLNHHMDAFKNIEKKMNLQYRIPYLTKEIENMEDIIYTHTSNNNIVLINFKYSNRCMICIYLPEILDEIDKKFIQDCIIALSNTELHLMRQKGEYFHSEDKSNYLQNMPKKLTFTLPR